MDQNADPQAAGLAVEPGGEEKIAGGGQVFAARVAGGKDDGGADDGKGVQGKRGESGRALVEGVQDGGNGSFVAALGAGLMQPPHHVHPDEQLLKDGHQDGRVDQSQVKVGAGKRLAVFRAGDGRNAEGIQQVKRADPGGQCNRQGQQGRDGMKKSKRAETVLAVKPEQKGGRCRQLDGLGDGRVNYGCGDAGEGDVN